MVELFCETGKIGEISNHGIGRVQRVDNEIDYFEDTYCETPVYYRNEEIFDRECKGNQHCLIEFNVFAETDITECYGDLLPELEDKLRGKYALFFEF